MTTDTKPKSVPRRTTPIHWVCTVVANLWAVATSSAQSESAAPVHPGFPTISDVTPPPQLANLGEDKIEDALMKYLQTYP